MSNFKKTILLGGIFVFILVLFIPSVAPGAAGERTAYSGLPVKAAAETPAKALGDGSQPAIVATSTLQAMPTILPTLPVPSNIQVEEDDNNVRLTWGEPMLPTKSNPDGVTGYKVTWGPAVNPAVSTQLTEYRAIQLQPLENGQPYQAVIQSVNSDGALSVASPAVFFTGDATRVNALRSKNTGFFDDFNTPQGPFNELNWNQAVSKCVQPAMTTSFINNQFHAHNMTLSQFCDRSQVINRVRSVFDFTGRTGSVSFDMDGALSRTIWYLDLLDANASGPLDITSHVDFFDSAAGRPGNELRVSQNGSDLKLGLVDSGGHELAIDGPNLEWEGLPVVPNYRRHWEIKISTSHVDILIDNKLVMSKDVALPFSKATLHWNFFSYNTQKNNVPYAMTHWDNFGFDGPASTIETHNYRTAQTNSRDYVEANNNNSPSLEIKIPDSLTGAAAQRLMFTIQPGTFSTYEWKADDKVVVNGTTIPIPQLEATPEGIDTLRPYGVILPLPAGLMRTGSNTVQFISSYLPVLNVHAEFDFAKGSAPPFTQPNFIYPETANQTPPMAMDTGPTMDLNKFNGQNIDDNPANFVYKVSGSPVIEFGVSNYLAMAAAGKNPGIVRVELRVNKNVVKEWNFNQPVPATNLSFALDTTRFANGDYQLDVIAYNTNGMPSIPNYFEGEAKQGDYRPLNIRIENSGAAAQTNKAAASTPSAAADTHSTSHSLGAATAAPVETKPAATIKTRKVILREGFSNTQAATEWYNSLLGQNFEGKKITELAGINLVEISSTNYTAVATVVLGQS